MGQFAPVSAAEIDVHRSVKQIAGPLHPKVWNDNRNGVKMLGDRVTIVGGRMEGFCRMRVQLNDDELANLVDFVQNAKPLGHRNIEVPGASDLPGDNQFATWRMPYGDLIGSTDDETTRHGSTHCGRSRFHIGPQGSNAEVGVAIIWFLSLVGRKRGAEMTEVKSVDSGIEPVVITAKQLAIMLQVSKRTLWRLRSAGRLPSPMRVGGIVRWRLDDVVDWIADGWPKVS